MSAPEKPLKFLHIRQILAQLRHISETMNERAIRDNPESKKLAPLYECPRCKAVYGSETFQMGKCLRCENPITKDDETPIKVTIELRFLASHCQQPALLMSLFDKALSNILDGFEIASARVTKVPYQD